MVERVVAAVPQATIREACATLEVSRSGFYYAPRPRARDERLKAVLPALARTQPRFGYRRLREAVCCSFEHVSRDTIQRLCQLLGLQVKPVKRRRKPRKAPEAVPGLRARYPHHVWCLDFLMDRTRDGRALRFLSVVDEHTRRCLALVVARRIRAVDVVGLLTRLMREHGPPVHVRSDNGPEFVATVVEAWATSSRIRLVRSAPASPWENPFSETYHSRLRDEFVEREEFGSVEEAQVLAEAYRVWYNEARMHSALGYLTPAAFAALSMGLEIGQPIPAVVQA